MKKEMKLKYWCLLLQNFINLRETAKRYGLAALLIKKVLIDQERLDFLVFTEANIFSRNFTIIWWRIIHLNDIMRSIFFISINIIFLRYISCKTFNDMLELNELRYKGIHYGYDMVIVSTLSYGSVPEQYMSA